MSGFQPIAGTPPSLEWVALDRLAIDPTYQRSSESGRSLILIRQIARGWDWRQFQPLSVARRADGALFVVDGQHRLAAARLRDDVPFLPVVIGNFGSVAEEAMAFEGMNRQRVAMSKIDRYRAAAAGGDPLTLEAAAALAAAGLRMARHSNSASWKPGDFGAIGSVVREIKREGRQTVEMALCALAEAFPGEAMTKGGAIFNGLVAIYAAPPEDFDPDLLIETLAKRTQEEWSDRGRSYRLSSALIERLAAPLAMRAVFVAEMAKVAERRGRA